ncbi:radical SAM protein [Cyanobacterium aponinum]|uniref:radical SAM protein n=1 Tax=Cyanobacterium aponinum TaxID=379064 RepID=UPI000C12DB8D|nr:radical SAM protein [Cyanobacterium aponinum]PHV63606.1 hypothetical protein CSQ80_04560 [Cyanobacterium aponinum IPPAS B-1201]
MSQHQTGKKSKLQSYLDSRPDLKYKYTKIRDKASNIVISGYDITKRCNLRCEGCFFFEGELSTKYEEIKNIEEYKLFFADEVKRGITYPHFAGAEPGLVQDRLLVANQFWDRGLIYTNGTFKFDPAITFMKHISVWGNFETDEYLRGAPVFKKALQNAQGDNKSIFMYTINKKNIDNINEVVKICKDHGVKISFNHYSPSRQYENKIELNEKTQEYSTFRLSTKDDNLMLTQDDLKKIRDILEERIDQDPETVIYSKHYNEYVNSGKTLWNIDEATGIAKDCVILNKPYHRQHHTDFSYDDSECCIANTDCRECRHYVSVYTKLMDSIRPALKSLESFESWLDIYYTWCKLHFVDWES